MNKKRLYDAAFVIISPVGTPWELSGETGGMYRKELIYPGHFIKMKPGTNIPKIEFDVDDRLIDHWVRVTGMMLSNGVEIPVAETHSMRPSDRRGSAIRFAKE